MKRMNLEIRITQQWQYISFYIFFPLLQQNVSQCVTPKKNTTEQLSWYYTPFQLSVSNYRITLYWCNWFLRPEQTLVTINHCNAPLLTSVFFAVSVLYLTSGGLLKYRYRERTGVGLIFQFLMMGFPSVSILAMMSWQLSQSQYIVE